MPRPKTDRPHTPKYARAKLSRRESHYFPQVIPQDTGQPGQQRYPSSYSP